MWRRMCWGYRSHSDGLNGPAKMEQDQVIFWTAFGAIGQAVGAIATAAAVIVALWVTMSERTVKIKISAGLRLIISGDGSPAIDVIAIRLTNVGLRGVQVRSIAWRTGRFSVGPVWLKQQFAVQTNSTIPESNNPPFDLQPGQEKTMYVDASVFVENDELRRTFFNRKLPFRGGVTPTPVYVMAHLVGIKPSLSRAERSLERFLTRGEIDAEGGAAHFNEVAERRRRNAS